MLPTYSKCLIFLLVALEQVQNITSQVFTLGSCPNPSPVSDFDIDQYLGKWYGNRNYFSIWQIGHDCVTVDYAKSGSRIIVTNAGLRLITRKKSTAIAKGRVTSSGKLNVSFITTNIFTVGNENYWILGTDYNSYAVGWSCLPFGIFNFRIAWILTREQNPSNATIDTALAVLKHKGIDQKKLKLVNQENCTESTRTTLSRL